MSEGVYRAELREASPGCVWGPAPHSKGFTEGLVTIKHVHGGRKGKENHVENLGERERKAELMAKDRGNMKCRKEKEQRKTQKTKIANFPGEAREQKILPFGCWAAWQALCTACSVLSLLRPYQPKELLSLLLSSPLFCRAHLHSSSVWVNKDQAASMSTLKSTTGLFYNMWNFSKKHKE